MKQEKKAIIVLIGKNGVGKQTIARELNRRYLMQQLLHWNDNNFVSMVNMCDFFVAGDSIIANLFRECLKFHHIDRQIYEIYIKASKKERTLRMENRCETTEFIENALKCDKINFMDYEPQYIVKNKSGKLDKTVEAIHYYYNIWSK